MLMEISTKENGRMVKLMVTEFSSILMAPCTRANGKKISKMVTAQKAGTITRSNIWVTSRKAKRREQVDSSLRVDTMKANFSMVNFMGSESITSQILANYTKENLKITTWTAKV